MAEYEWIKKLVKRPENKNEKKSFDDYVDRDKFDEVKESMDIDDEDEEAKDDTKKTRYAKLKSLFS